MQKLHNIGKRYFELMILCSLALFFFLNACGDDNNIIIIDPPSSTWLIVDYYPSWSPDGKSIAYIHSYENAGLYIIDTSGNNNTMILSDPYINSIDFSPTGDWIVYESRSQIYKIKKKW